MWDKLAGPWRVEHLDALAHEATLDDLPACVERILAGQLVGRTVIAPSSTRV
jgi:alcohol dehydrogenase